MVRFQRLELIRVVTSAIYLFNCVKGRIVFYSIQGGPLKVLQIIFLKTVGDKSTFLQNILIFNNKFCMDERIM